MEVNWWGVSFMRRTSEFYLFNSVSVRTECPAAEWLQCMPYTHNVPDLTLARDKVWGYGYIMLMIVYPDAQQQQQITETISKRCQKEKCFLAVPYSVLIIGLFHCKYKDVLIAKSLAGKWFLRRKRLALFLVGIYFGEFFGPCVLLK